ncbi:MAG: formate dehydrogenase accessory sulfurtransferase FdhD [Sphingomonadaceae bacterium]
MKAPELSSINRTLGVLRPDEPVGHIMRPLAIEIPIAIEFNGIGYAVMMATPTDLQDFAIGFGLSERLITSPRNVVEIEAIEQSEGMILRIALDPDHMAPILDRARQRVSESSCGLCGLESLEQVMRPLPKISARPSAIPAALFAALEALRDHQPLSVETGAVHGAAFCAHDGTILIAREDVGRHNALDKLIGALARGGMDPASGFILVTARCSYELVEKTIIAGCPMLVTISAPTSLAVERAAAHDLTLIVLARRDAMLVANDPAGLYS